MPEPRLAADDFGEECTVGIAVFTNAHSFHETTSASASTGGCCAKTAFEPFHETVLFHRFGRAKEFRWTVVQYANPSLGAVGKSKVLLEPPFHGRRDAQMSIGAGRHRPLIEPSNHPYRVPIGHIEHGVAQIVPVDDQARTWQKEEGSADAK